MIHDQGRKRKERVHDQSGLNRTVESFAFEEAERPFIGKCEDAKEQIQQLENRDRLHDRIEVGGSKIPEDLGPKEAFDCGGDLV